MNIDKLKNAKANKEAEEEKRIQEYKKRMEKAYKKFETEFKNCIKQQINRIDTELSDDFLDELLSKNIFENDNTSESYNITLKFHISSIKLKIKHKNNKDCSFSRYYNASINTSEINIFNKTLYLGKYFDFYGHECLQGDDDDVIEEENPEYSSIIFNHFYEHNGYRPSCWNDSDLFNYPYIDCDGSIDFDNIDQDYIMYKYYNPNMTDELINKIINRLTDYGLKIIDTKQEEENFDKDSEKINVELIIKFANPLLSN